MMRKICLNGFYPRPHKIPAVRHLWHEHKSREPRRLSCPCPSLGGDLRPSCKSYFAHILSILHHELNAALAVKSIHYLARPCLFLSQILEGHSQIAVRERDTTSRARTFLRCRGVCELEERARTRILMDLLKSKSWFLKGSANTMRALMADERGCDWVVACELIWPRVRAGYILAQHPKFKALLMQAQTMQSHLTRRNWMDGFGFYLSPRTIKSFFDSLLKNPRCWAADKSQWLIHCQSMVFFWEISLLLRTRSHSKPHCLHWQ